MRVECKKCGAFPELGADHKCPEDSLANKIAALQRYWMYGGCGIYEGSVDVEKDPDGAWVRWDDIEEILEQFYSHDPNPPK